ncbi:hypothetical protein CYMTET_44730 [Cymbomonas tetramitiformis]|uniref:Uncharacterized protein n=1 Tax=Cymbomonas tetramitiformis TaxID=36881 RepID=A0AAE0C0W2_9CHLO|nr:hypothetical protein CYMTET_44730 [Cymbomonas tetramitiformis]
MGESNKGHGVLWKIRSEYGSSLSALDKATAVSPDERHPNDSPEALNAAHEHSPSPSRQARQEPRAPFGDAIGSVTPRSGQMPFWQGSTTPREMPQTPRVDSADASASTPASTSLGSRTPRMIEKSSSPEKDAPARMWTPRQRRASEADVKQLTTAMSPVFDAAANVDRALQRVPEAAAEITARASAQMDRVLVRVPEATAELTAGATARLDRVLQRVPGMAEVPAKVPAGATGSLDRTKHKLDLEGTPGQQRRKRFMSLYGVIGEPGEAAAPGEVDSPEAAPDHLDLAFGSTEAPAAKGQSSRPIRKVKHAAAASVGMFKEDLKNTMDKGAQLLRSVNEVANSPVVATATQPFQKGLRISGNVLRATTEPLQAAMATVPTIAAGTVGARQGAARPKHGLWMLLSPVARPLGTMRRFVGGIWSKKEGEASLSAAISDDVEKSFVRMKLDSPPQQPRWRTRRHSMASYSTITDTEALVDTAAAGSVGILPMRAHGDAPGTLGSARGAADDRTEWRRWFSRYMEDMEHMQVRMRPFSNSEWRQGVGLRCASLCGAGAPTCGEKGRGGAISHTRTAEQC